MNKNVSFMQFINGKNVQKIQISQTYLVILADVFFKHDVFSVSLKRCYFENFQKFKYSS